jgi:hypothetical protein
LLPLSSNATLHLLCALDDVGVREDVALLVEHEARAGRRAAGRARLDEGDSGAVLLVDLVDGLPGDGLERRVGRPVGDRDRRLAGRRRRVIAGVDHACGQQDANDHGDDEATGQAGQEWAAGRGHADVTLLPIRTRR